MTTDNNGALRELAAVSNALLAECLDAMRLPKELQGRVSLGDLFREAAKRVRILDKVIS
jgi:hypothetical protein